MRHWGLTTFDNTSNMSEGWRSMGKKVNTNAIAFKVQRCEAPSHSGVLQKAISPGQAQHTLIKTEAERQTAGLLHSSITWGRKKCEAQRWEKQSSEVCHKNLPVVVLRTMSRGKLLPERLKICLLHMAKQWMSVSGLGLWGSTLKPRRVHQTAS